MAIKEKIKKKKKEKKNEKRVELLYRKRKRKGEKKEYHEQVQAMASAPTAYIPANPMELEGGAGGLEKYELHTQASVHELDPKSWARRG